MSYISVGCALHFGRSGRRQIMPKAAERSARVSVGRKQGSEPWPRRSPILFKHAILSSGSRQREIQKHDCM